MAGPMTQLIHAERHALAEDLAALGDDAWRAPSLCEGWSVQDVVAHLVDRNRLTPGGAVVGVVRHRGLQRMIDAGVEARRGTTPDEVLDEFTRTADRPTPGPIAREFYLGELVIHAEDIRRPLGITHLYPRAEVGAILRTRARLARPLVRGLALVATDTGDVLGHGPSVRGPAMSLLMAVSGRTSHLEDLTGAGAAAFSARVRAR